MARSVSNSVLQQVLAQGNKEQNQHYSPRIFEVHFQLASDWMKDELVKQYPTAQLVVDLLMPYMQTQMVLVKSGRIPLPDVYRNLLGFGFYYTGSDKVCKPFTPNYKKEPTLKQLQDQLALSQAESNPIDMITIDQWNYFSKHPYKKPKYVNAKGCVFEDKMVRILPPDIPHVEVRFVKVVPEFKFGYKMNPDETYVFDPGTTVEELWNENAIPYLFKAVNLLYANYIKDTDYIASAHDLRDNSLF